MLSPTAVGPKTEYRMLTTAKASPLRDKKQPGSHMKLVRRARVTPEASEDLIAAASHFSTRQRAAREILASEKSYLASLGCLVDDFYKPLKKLCGSLNQIFTKAELKTIFGNLLAIQNLSRKLLAALREAGVDGCLGSVFVKFAPFMKIYKEYVRTAYEGMSIVVAALQGTGRQWNANAVSDRFQQFHSKRSV